MTFVRFLMLLALVVWIGGIIFFAFVMAPALFTILPSRELAGTVVSRSLGALHWIGIGCGAVFVLGSVAESYARTRALHVFAVRNLLVTAMLALTLVSQVVVGGRMRQLRASMGTIDAVSSTDARRAEFDSLHQWSTRLEGLVLLFGLAALFDTTRTISKPQTRGSATTA